MNCPFKGGSISESFLLWFHLQKNVPNHYARNHYPHKENRLRIVILHTFWRWNQSETLSEIKPLLENTIKSSEILRV